MRGPGSCGRSTVSLDELLSGVWEGLAAHRPVACPVCGSDMTPAGAHARPIVAGAYRATLS